jgi:RND family efflux transporter MFP subunit
MASKLIYPVVAVVGIAAASGAAWWYQNKAAAPKGVVADAGSGAAPATRGGGGAAGGAPGASGPGGGGARVVGVEVARVQAQRLRDAAESVGSLRSRQSVMLRPEVAGRVKELGFSDGAFVRKGQLLVQLDDTLQRAEIRQAAAQVSIAQANFKRNQELVAQGFVAQRSLDESAANLQVAEAQLSLGCARQMRMAIVAPFDGTVGLRNVNLGDYVKDGADLVNLEDTGSMYVDFRLPERYQGQLRVRQTVELLIDSLPGRVFRASVEAIDPLLDVNGRSVGVRAVLPNTAGEAGAGPRGGGNGAGGARGAGGPGGAGGAGPGGPAGPAGAAGGSVRADGASPAKPGDAAKAPAPAVARAAAAAPAAAPAARSGNMPVRATVTARAPTPVQGCPTADDPATAAQASPRGGAMGGGPLRPGMFARVTAVFGERENARVIPEEAIVPQGGRQTVIKLVDGPDGDTKIAQRVEVKVGIRRPGRVEITDGLQAGDVVVTAGQQRVQRDGMAVRVIDMARPAGGPRQGQGGAPGAAPAGAPGGPAGAAPASAKPAAPVVAAAPAARLDGPNPCAVTASNEAAARPRGKS